MKSIIFVVGGSRSGKSDYAQARAEAISSASRYFIATCPVVADDQEMARRITGHQQKRVDRHWQTREEPLNIAAVVDDLSGEATILIDCLTLWVSNLMMAEVEISEDFIRQKAEELLASCRKHNGSVILVSGEVGCATVPEHPLARKFRDLVGRVNQSAASLADEVILVSCGISQKIKG